MKRSSASRLVSARKRLLYRLWRRKRIFLRGIAGLIIFFCSQSAVSADSFYPGGDSNSCSLAGVVGVQYSRLGSSGIHWNSGDVQGVADPWIRVTQFRDVANPWYPNAARYDFVADIVAVPPGSRVELGMYLWNHSGHTVNVNKIELYTSLDLLGHGDISKLGAGGEVVNSCFKLGGVMRCRNSKTVSIPVNWDIRDRNATVQDSFGKIFYGFDTIQPIQLRSFNATPRWTGRDLVIDYSLRLANVSDYSSCDINVWDQLPSGEIYDRDFCINAHSEIVVEYSANMGQVATGVINNDPAKITDRNSRQEQTTYIGSHIHDRTPTVLPAIFFRNDSNATGWYAPQPTWGEMGRPLTFILIPYWFYTDPVSVYVSERISLEAYVSDEDESMVKNNEIGNGESMIYTVRLRNEGSYIDRVCIFVDFVPDLIDAEISQVGCVENLYHGEEHEFVIPVTIGNLPEGDYAMRANFQVSGHTNASDFVDSNISSFTRLEYDIFVSDHDELRVKENLMQGLSPEADHRVVKFEVIYGNSGNADFGLYRPILDLSSWGDRLDVQKISHSGVHDENSRLVSWDISNLLAGDAGVLLVEGMLRLPGELRNVNERYEDTIYSATLSDLSVNSTISYPNVVAEFNQEGQRYRFTLSNVGEGILYQPLVGLEVTLPEGFLLDESVSDLYDFDVLGPHQEQTIEYLVSVPSELPPGRTLLRNEINLLAFGYEAERFVIETQFEGPEPVVLHSHEVLILPEEIGQISFVSDDLGGQVLGASTVLARSGQATFVPIGLSMCGIIISRRKKYGLRV